MQNLKDHQLIGGKKKRGKPVPARNNGRCSICRTNYRYKKDKVVYIGYGPHSDAVHESCENGEVAIHAKRSTG